jgi:hypothetical protein
VCWLGALTGSCLALAKSSFSSCEGALPTLPAWPSPPSLTPSNQARD